MSTYKSILILSVFIISNCCSYALDLNKRDSITMRQEADTFLSRLPEGMQQTQTHAVNAAICGDCTFINEVRNSRNNPPRYSDNVSVIDTVIHGKPGHGIPIRLYSLKKRESSDPLPLLIYFHGGGWTFGSLNSCARFCDAIASTGKANVLSVDYSLAPEHPYPEGLHDCIATVSYAMHNTEWLGTDIDLISVGGDSSGGNLALATALALNREETSTLRSIIMFYPVLKAENDHSESWMEFGKGFGLDSDLMESFNNAYYSSCPEDKSQIEMISPAYASDDAVRQLPPILMINAQRDILTSQGLEFAQRLSRAGVPINHFVFPGTVHLFITVAGQDKAFSESVRLTTSFLTAH